MLQIFWALLLEIYTNSDIAFGPWKSHSVPNIWQHRKTGKTIRKRGQRLQ